MNNITFNDGPLQAIYIKGDDNRYTGSIDNYTINQTKPTSSTTWDSLESYPLTDTSDAEKATKYAIRSDQPRISIGKGNIKGYSRNQGLRPLFYTPKIYGSTAGTSGDSTTNYGSKKNVIYKLDGSICTIFVHLWGLTNGSNLDGNFRLMLPFKPLAPYPTTNDAVNGASAFVEGLDFSTNPGSVTSLAVRILPDKQTRWSYLPGNQSPAGYIQIRYVLDNGTVGSLDANLISSSVDISFTLSYEIDESVGTNFINQW